MCVTRFSSNQEPERRIHLSLHVFQGCGKKTKVGLLLIVFLVTQPVPLTFINLHRFDGEGFDISLSIRKKVFSQTFKTDTTGFAGSLEIAW